MSATSRSNALTAIAPLKPWRLWWCRLVLPALRILVTSSSLVRLRAIHFAGWVVTGRPPGRRPRGWRSRPSMVFLSDFDGDLDEYLAAFGLAVTSGMHWTFGSAAGFPGTRPTRRFIDYVHRHRVEELWRYAAYPDRTVRDIDEALEVTRRLDAARRAAAGPDEQLQAAFGALLAALGRAPEPAVPSFWWGLCQALWSARPWSRGGVRGLVSLVPVSPGREEDLRTAVAALAAEHPTVFDRTGGVHFARLALVPMPGRPDQAEAAPAPPPVAPRWLLLSAWVDGDLRAFLDRLVAALGDGAAALWACCAGAPPPGEPEAVAAWVAAHGLRISLFAGTHTAVPVDRIRRTLVQRDAVLDVATRLQDRPVGEIRSALEDLGRGPAAMDVDGAA